MKTIDVIKAANGNLFRSKLRTLLTVLAIFVGGFVLTLTMALNAGTGDYLDRQLGNVSVPGVFEVFPKAELNPFGSGEIEEYDPESRVNSLEAAFTSASMTKDDIDKLAAVEGVETATPYYSIVAEYIQRDSGKKYNIPQLVQDFDLNLDLSAGRLPEDDDKNSIILPEDYLGPLEISAEDAIGKEVKIGYRNLTGDVVERNLTVIGVMRKSFLTSGQTYIDVNTAREIAEEQGQSGRYLVSIVKFTEDAINNNDESVLKDRIQGSGNYTAASVQERISSVLTVVDAITMSLNMVGVIALIAASFGIINTLLMSVYERTREVGLMKALGMRRRAVFSLFAIEAVLVGFWGSVVAVITAAGVAQLVNAWASESFLKDFEGFTLLLITPVNALIVMAIIMAIAFLAGTLPALKASRLDPIEALRSE